MSRRIWINADDFGWTDGHNRAVKRAFECGGLQRASLLCNQAAFTGAVEMAHQLKGLEIGVHLTLNEGRPLLDPSHLPILTRPRGDFYDEVLDLLRMWFMGRLKAGEATLEWRAQIERSLQAGLHPGHLNSHKHVHLLPPLLDGIISLASEYQISYVRLPLEKMDVHNASRGPAALVLWLLARRARSRLREANLTFADHFVGFGLSGTMTSEHLRQAIANAPEGVTEIMVHPAIVTPAVMALRQRYRWAARYRFEEELDALCAIASDIS